VQVSKHVIQDGGSTSQIVISETGEALLFDCGKEFTLERLQEAKAKFGIDRVDVIIPSHWHYDHVDGIAAIAKSEGAKVWVWEGLAEYIEHPEHFPTTCWTGKKINVDRILKENVEFEWGGYSFKVYHHPVHTEQQMGLYAKVDGLDFYFIADGTGFSKEGVRASIHCYNGLSLSSGLLKSAQSFSEANPYICLPAHSNVFATNGEDKEEFKEWASKTTDAIKDLLPPDNPDLAYDPYWASFYPARIHIKAGDKVEISLRLKNYSGKALTGKCRLKCYGDFTFENEVIAYEMKTGETKDFPVIVKSKKSAGKGIHIITADIEYDNTVFAEFPQAYLQIDE
jgi:glyoxylase-like metal-dependent hydrolase (beta-lactamase superfamily II)